MRIDLRPPEGAFAPANKRRLRKYRSVDKIEIQDYCGRTYLAYDVTKALVGWRHSRSSRPPTRERVLQDIQALLEGLLALDDRGNVTVPQPLPPARSPKTLAAIQEQLVKAGPVVTAVLKGNLDRHSSWKSGSSESTS